MLSFKRTDDICEIIFENPPVNAFGASLRKALLEAVNRAEDDALIRVVLLRGVGKMFSAGADISEFDRPEEAPGLSELVDRIEACSKPVLGVLHGQCLGGGLEVAMGCHYRIAARSTRIALPEVTLGLLPGAGGTQRLPRLIGAIAALDMIVTGAPISAQEGEALGLIDQLADDQELASVALEYARTLSTPRRTGDRAVAASADEVDAYVAANPRKYGGLEADKACVEAVKAATHEPFAQGLALEKSLFDRLVKSDQARALQHAFFAERRAATIADLPKDMPKRSIGQVGVIGAGTMGTGIAMNFLIAGIPVILVEKQADALQRGVETIARTFASSVAKGKMKADQEGRANALLTPTIAFDALSACDLIIEAVFEDMAVKKDIFRTLDQIAKPGAILASNTSFLDIDEMAAVTQRPDDVVGLHFFSPANIMKLIEVIKGAQTGQDVLATCMDLARRIGKAPVLSGVCYGFIGNRMLLPRLDQAKQLLLEGATIAQIDSVSIRLGLPVGPLQMIDLAGVDIGWHRDPSRIDNLNDALCASGRLGQKSGAGYYDYDDRRRPVCSPAVDAIIQQFRAEAGIEPRPVSDEEILVRTVHIMINEAALILEEGIAQRASDIDTVWMLGFGWPRWTGGPLWWAQQKGVDGIVEDLERHRGSFDPSFAVAKSLKKGSQNYQPFYPA
ncbi:3-hydroxyacyl-CoA dehydrogenase NAD-binding domain-containing protein [Sphingobium sp. CR2-8]|uniref:3-hydroxyacyl-CoA dehydrogenase NAD-binding domain-containing protein n=1 Tax=Sphingobium sp. CR2-8 TaxID=1306534 RepID=UPI002DB8337F|nr:3-hydroxyacyl-CoA dehydrogenase NAD-binding domain-containing protein [Sphingobium sp. CR2-8]MEC3909536.1 3-hydroxyacyl-CoA dehydrogenase NAD-binding domain-containing protein [Sphingobium sp. CR2-8]